MAFMNRRSISLLLGVAIIAVLFAAAAVVAGTTVADDIIFKPILDTGKYKDKLVHLSHKKHVEEYGAKCGDCHHDDQGKPLDLKEGDDVQKCIECHKKPGERPKGKNAPKLSKKERLEYHAEAFHYNCKACHKKHNKAKKTKAAPTTCTKCHVKP